MFGFGKKHRVEKEAEAKAKAAADLRATLADLIQITEGAEGKADDWSLVLHSGERLVYGIRGGGLFEPRRMPGQWSGRSAGISVPVADGIRLRVGKSAGTFVQGDEEPTLIDTGDVSLTTQRVVFQGDKYTREWLYAKLIGIMHYADQPRTAIQVSNRQKTSGIVYAGLPADLVRLRLAVAVAIFNGEAKETAQKLRDELSKLDTAAPISPEVGDAGPTTPPEEIAPPGGARPDDRSTAPTATSQEAPSGPPGPTTGADATANPAKSEQPPSLPRPMWATDPSEGHQLRYWDGSGWTEYVSDNGKESRDPAPWTRSAADDH